MEHWNGSGPNPRDHKIGRLGAISIPVLAMVAIGYGAAGYPIEIGKPVGAHNRHHDGVEGITWRPEFEFMIGWLKEKLMPSNVRPPVEEKYATAMKLTNEVERTMQERAASPDPFRAILAEFWLQQHDVALITEAFETHQESRIYKGPS